MQRSHEAFINFLIKVISQKWLLANSTPSCQDALIYEDLQVKSEWKCASSVCATVKQKEGRHRSALSFHPSVSDLAE